MKKYYGAYFKPSGRIEEVLSYIEDNTKSPHRVVCKARSLDNANDITSELEKDIYWYDTYDKVSEEKELIYFRNEDVKFIIQCGLSYLTDIELNQIIKEVYGE